jgi:multidrug transporter EmrE-like cation transporter
MKPISIVGLLLVVVGIAALAIGRFSYTTEEKVLEVGPLVATADQEHTVHIPDIVGILAIVAGVALVVAGRRRA